MYISIPGALTGTRSEYKRQLVEGPQILHVNGFHWVVAFLRRSSSSTTYIDYADSLHGRKRRPNQDVKSLCQLLSPNATVNRPLRVQQQKGSVDCGLFAIANLITFCQLQGLDVTSASYTQQSMRKHSISCFRKKYMTAFP